MNRSYADITDRLGDPLWWDDNAVPRYAPFDPGLCGIYACYVAYMEIACQACGRRFLVARCVDELDIAHWPELAEDKPGGGWQLKPEHMPHKEDSGIWHCAHGEGDPPNHDCPIGNTENCIDLRIIEFWESLRGGWTRRPEYEVTFDPLEEVSDTL